MKSQSIAYSLNGSEHIYIYWMWDLESEVHSILDLWISGLQECKDNGFPRNWAGGQQFSVGYIKSRCSGWAGAPARIFLPRKSLWGELNVLQWFFSKSDGAGRRFRSGLENLDFFLGAALARIYLPRKAYRMEVYVSFVWAHDFCAHSLRVIFSSLHGMCELAWAADSRIHAHKPCLENLQLYNGGF